MKEELQSERIKRYIKSCTINLIISSVLFILLIAIIFYIINIDKYHPKEYYDLNYLIQEYLGGKEINNKPAYIVINSLFEPEATYEEDGNVKRFYCVAFDEYNYMYLVALSKKDYENLNYFVENSISDNPINMSSIELKGVVKTIPNDLKDILMENFELIYEEDILEYFGGVFLDTTQTANSELATLLEVIVLFGTIFNLCYFLVYFNASKTTNKTLKTFENEIDQIYAEIDTVDKNTKIFLMNKYLVDYSNGLRIVRYEDIKLLYLEIHRQNYIKVDSYIKVYLSKKESFTILSARKSKLTEEQQNQILMEIAQKCPNAKVGYTKENLESLES